MTMENQATSCSRSWVFRRIMALVLAVSLLGVSVAGWRSSHRLYFDQAWQLMAVRDYVDGVTPGPNWIRSAVPSELTKDSWHWSLNWPPGYSFLVLGIHSITQDFATAHRLLAWLCAVVGIIGWYRVFGELPFLPVAWQAAGLLVITLSGAYSVVEFHPEAFVYATTPWQLWLALRLVSTHQSSSLPHAGAFALGGLTGLAYVMKYSAALSGIPLLATTALVLWRNHRPARGTTILLLAVGAAIPVLALNFYNLSHGGAINPTTSAAYHHGFRFPTAIEWINLASGPYLALAGSEGILGRLANLALGPAHSVPELTRHAIYTGSLGLLSVLVLAYLVRRCANRSFLLAVALAVNGFAILALIWIWGTNKVASSEARHFTGMALCWFPVLLIALHRAWSSHRRLALLAILALGPALIGTAQQAWGLIRASTMLPPAALGGFRLDPALDMNRLHAQVQSRTGISPDQVIWLCFEPRTLWTLGGRHISESYAHDQQVVYAASNRVTVVVLVPKAPPMSPDVYHTNLNSLQVDFAHPDFSNDDYLGFIRWVGPNGCEALRPT